MTIINNDVTLKVGGKIWGGWTDVEIHTGIETAAGSFDLALTERWPGQQAKQDIQPGAAAVLQIGGVTVITGYVDAVEPSYDSHTHALKVTGRDAAGDLVDCSAINNPGRWMSTAPLDVANAITKPFGIKVATQVDLGKPLAMFALQMGETAWEAIERLARYLGVLATSDGLGGLVFVRSGTGGSCAELALGNNILRGSASYEYKGRFSQVIVLGQSQGNDYVPPEQSAGGKATSTDAGITRYRPKIVMAEMAATGTNFQTRADWEQAVRVGRSRKLNITVQGWRDANGDLYASNKLVMINDNFLDIHEQFLVSEVAFAKGESGTLTTLTLMPPAAFTPEPVPPEGFMSDNNGGLRVNG